jgi:hypothetical protein
VRIFNLPFTYTEKEGRSMTEQIDVIAMKTFNSGAIMLQGLIYRPRSNKFEFYDTYQSKYNHQNVSLIVAKEIFIAERNIQFIRVAAKIDRLN